jgi:hypothetical protein
MRRQVLVPYGSLSCLRQNINLKIRVVFDWAHVKFCAVECAVLQRCKRTGQMLHSDKLLNVRIFWDIAPCNSYMNKCFGGTYHLYLQGRISAYQETSEMSVYIGLHDSIAQKMAKFITTAVRTSNRAKTSCSI